MAELARAADVLDRARRAAQMRDLAEGLVASSVRDASRAGTSWRAIGMALDLPFQTVHRRYREAS